MDLLRHESHQFQSTGGIKTSCPEEKFLPPYQAEIAYNLKQSYTIL